MLNCKFQHRKIPLQLIKELFNLKVPGHALHLVSRVAFEQRGAACQSLL